MKQKDRNLLLTCSFAMSCYHLQLVNTSSEINLCLPDRERLLICIQIFGCSFANGLIESIILVVIEVDLIVVIFYVIIVIKIIGTIIFIL